MPSAGGLIISTDALDHSIDAVDASRCDRKMGRNRYGRHAGWEDPTADRERELLLRDDDRKRRALDRQKRALQERDEFLSMQIAQAEFLEHANAPVVRRRFQDPPTHEGGAAFTTSNRNGPRPRVLGREAGLYQTNRRAADARGAARRPVWAAEPGIHGRFIGGAGRRGGATEAAGLPGAGAAVAIASEAAFRRCPRRPRPTDWLAELGNEQSEAARTRRPRRRRARAPPPRSYLSMMAKDARSSDAAAAARRGARRVYSVSARRGAAAAEKAAQDARGLETRQVLARRAGRRLLGQRFETWSRRSCPTRPRTARRRGRRCRSGRPQNEQVVSRRPSRKKSPTASQKRAASLVDDLGNDGKTSREEARELRELLTRRSPGARKQRAESTRRAPRMRR